jgi:RHS repeat-associated protein
VLRRFLRNPGGAGMLTASDEGSTVTYRYDAANQLTQLVEPGGACPASGAPAANSGCVLFEYDVNGLETKRIFPGGASTVTARDASGRPTRITAAPPTSQGPRFDVSYSYAAPAGDRSLTQTRTAHTEVGVAGGAVTTYSYDSRNRLTLAEEKTGATVSASWAYQYDAAGNRTQQVRTGSTGAPAGTINYQYNAANQVTSATGQTTTWTYDGAGNQTRNGLTGKTATFDDRGAQTKLGAVGSSYYASGNDQRMSTDGGLVFTDGPLGLMRRQDRSRTTYFADTKYTRTPDGEPVSARDHTSGEAHYFIRDRNDSVAGLFSGTGGSFGGWSYSPYGEERAFSPSTYPPLQYNFIRYISGHYEGENIYKLGARYYDAALGRFTQVDPSGQEQNPYSYSSGDPVNLSDPTGLLPEGAAGLIASAPAALIGFGVAGVVGGPLGLGIGIGYAVVAGATASGVEASLSGASDEEVTRQTILGGVTGGLGAFFVR